MEHRVVISIYKDEDEDEEIWREGRRDKASVGSSVQCSRFQKKVLSSIYSTLLHFSYHDAASPKLPGPLSCKVEYVTLQGCEGRDM